MRLLLLLLLLSPAASAQFLPEGSRSFAAEEMVPLPSGFLGLAYDRNVTHLTWYDLQFRYLGTRAYRPLQVIDVATFSSPVATIAGAVLGRSGNGSALYLLSILPDHPPALRPIRDGDLPRLERIVAAGTLVPGMPPHLALVGDTSFVVLDTSGGEIYSRHGLIRDVVFDSRPPARFIVALHVARGTELQWIDAAGGTTLARRRIDHGGGIRLFLQEELVAMATTPPYIATIMDRATTRVIDTARLASRALAVLQGKPSDEGSGPMAIIGGYPGPRLVPLIGSGPARRFEYPFLGTIDQVVVAGDLVGLLSGDSLAVFDRQMNLLGMTSTIATGGDLSLRALDSTALLVSSQSGSQLLFLERSLPGWIERNWRTAALVFAGLILLTLGVAILRRYLFVRSIYNNLVGGRGSGGILVMSGSQRVRHINATARSMLDIAGYIPMGRHIREYLTAEEQRPVIEALRGLFASSVPFEIRIDTGGSRHYSFRGRPMFGRYGFNAGYLLLVEDVTESIAQERLVNWASLAHHIAHEMKTPLSTVRVTAEMLRDRLGNNGADHDELRATTRIIRQSERLRSIVDDLLTVARTESLRKVAADLGLLLPSLAHDYLEYLPTGVDLRLTMDGDDFHCHIDVAQVTVALRNLLDNARHAIGTRPGGRIDFTMQAGDDLITITVADNGVGMGPATLARLFQPFYTEREGGSGIGTIIIKRVIEGHGGRIGVASTEGVGTTFTVTLPRG